MRRPFFLALVLGLPPCLAWAQAPIKDCADCPELLAIPRGTFVMGSNDAHENERPQRKVTIAKPFYLGRFEITFDQWQACFEASACKRLPDDHKWGKGDRPVMNVAFDDAQDYLAWISKKSGKRYRLPSEAEWEWAARGGVGTLYPWGDKMAPGKANCRDCGAEPFGGFSTAPVGSYPPNGYGLYDMNGNVWEWTQDCWHPDHKGAPTEQKPRGPAPVPEVPGLKSCDARVMKGGAWYYYAVMSRPQARAKNDATAQSYVLGFRVARDAD